MILQELLEQAGTTVKRAHREHEVYICCPFCEERGRDRDFRFRLGINLFSGLAHCYHCEWASGRLRHTAEELARIFGLPLHWRPTRRRSQPEAPVEETASPEKIELPAEYETFIGSDDPVERKAREYLRQRGVSISQIARHKIGYAAAGRMSWRILFPVLSKGMCYGCVGRDFSGEQSPKYLNTPGIKMLWGTEIYGETAVVTEGIMDALRVEAASLHYARMVSLARLGSAITDVQIEQLRKYEKVIVLPDWDCAGVHGAMELARRMDETGVRILVDVPERMDGSDPGSSSVEALVYRIEHARRWSEAVNLRLREAITHRVAQ